jgi:CheY-like chemotaxis protein
MNREFLMRANSQLGEMQDCAQAIFQATDDKVREELLAALYLRFNSLLPAANLASGHPAFRLCVALEALVKKLLQNPKHCTSSALFTITTTIGFLNELCSNGVRADLATNPPIRILVVDDDPFSRRAVAGALQLAFEKPDSADSGEAAINAANQDAFDLIFLDVQMPGMDGFTTSLRIHETVLNHTTPVVFVTGQSDFKSRTQATLSGGGDFIAKPFLLTEVTVKALTHALRGRLRRLRAGAPLLATPEELATDQTPASEGSDRAEKRRKMRSQERRFKRFNRVSHQSA